MITTKHRGVFLGQVKTNTDLTAKTLTDIANCKMVIKWRNGKGLDYMASHGPTDKCMVSPGHDVEVLHDITAVWKVSDEAAAKIWG